MPWWSSARFLFLWLGTCSGEERLTRLTSDLGTTRVSSLAIPPHSLLRRLLDNFSDFPLSESDSRLWELFIVSGSATGDLGLGTSLAEDLVGGATYKSILEARWSHSLLKWSLKQLVNWLQEWLNTSYYPNYKYEQEGWESNYQDTKEWLSSAKNTLSSFCASSLRLPFLNKTITYSYERTFIKFNKTWSLQTDALDPSLWSKFKPYNIKYRKRWNMDTILVTNKQVYEKYISIMLN